MAVEPGAAPFDGPEQLVERRDGDHAQDGLAGDDQADADGPERQAVDHVARAVDRVDRPAPRAGSAGGLVFLAGQRVVGKPIAQSLANQPLQVLIEVGHVAQVRLFLRRDRLASCSWPRPRPRCARALTNSSSAARSDECQAFVVSFHVSWLDAWSGRSD